MLNFIIYEDEKKFREKYISIILKLIGGMKIAYRIVEIDHYDKNTLSQIKNLVGKKIFILDIEVPGKSGLDLAREIRNGGDWESPMIIITTHEQLKTAAFTSRMLMLDFISKFYNCEENLKDTLKISLDIIKSTPSLNFQYNGELVQIPYRDILFIEKNVDDLYSTVVTKNERLKIKLPISTIEEELTKDIRFFRTHRSCIVNLDKVTKVELRNCIIHFGNIETPLLSRDKKTELKIRLGKEPTKRQRERGIGQCNL
ncbi:MAG: LytTR family DNA-binding domain-containing protein [Tenericutes bacterium]|nr:LytTR family DNA-binding domain-containing protein [Mycoplasmatota bacterium]